MKKHSDSNHPSEASKPMSSCELTQQVFYCLLDGYYDEEYKEQAESELYTEVSQLLGDSAIRHAL